MRPFPRAAATALLVALLAGCATQPPAPAARPSMPTLADTKWELVQFQSAKDSIGTIKPDDPSHYTMELMPGGQLAMQLNCNRAAGRWEAHAASPTDGQISFIAPVMTRAMCLGPSMDERIARDLEFVTSYRLIGDTLNLALKADSGIYTWRRLSP